MKAERQLKIVNPSGLHMRPLARFIEAASSFECSVTVSNLTTHSEAVDAKSILSVLTLGVEYGHEILISTDGPDAEEACNTLANVVTVELKEIEID